MTILQKKPARNITLKARRGVENPLFERIYLQPPDSIYFMGICGTALASLAIFLKTKGFSVSGSDKNIYPPMSSLLKQNKIPVQNYNSKNLSSSIKLIVVGNVISKNHPEVEALEKLHIPYTSFPEFLEQVLLSGKKNIVVAGTHGKTTTTSLVSYVAEKAGKNPGFFIGGQPRNFKTSFQWTNSNWFAIEGDEYDTAFFAKHPKFFHYPPFALILTGVEFDHGDIYKDFQTILSLFTHLLTQVPPEGFIVASVENKGLQRILKKTEIKASLITYGINEGDFQAKDICLKNGKSRFKIIHGKKNWTLSLNLLGEHNVLNALSVFALAYKLKWPIENVLKAFISFKGVTKRLEKIEDRGNILIMEDFAHHPTAVKMTLEGLKKAMPHRRLIAVFEPRSFTSCLNIFQEDYAKALSIADQIAIMKPFRIILGKKNLSVDQLTRDIQVTFKKKAFFSHSVEDMAYKLLALMKSGDIFLLMSNGDFGNLAQKLKKGLKQKFP